MTKCHLTLLAVVLTLLTACKPDKGPSLSEYGSQSAATRQLQFEQYARELLALPLEDALQRQDSVLRAAEKDSAAWKQAVEMQEKFFYDPNSPYRSEELYLPVVEHLIDSPFATEEERAHARWLQPFLLLNRIGMPAADFAFRTRNGRTHTLYGTLDNRKPAPRQTILFFSNPGCPNCKEITEALSGDPVIRDRIAKGDLLVINIYPDEELQAWLDYLPNYPEEWICGYDPDQVLRSSTRYWLRAIPSLYLLDAEKRVVLKDATLERLLIDCKQR